ncbi:hypothetical protein [Streptomyces sp. NBC_00859]|nr:hypothetical protein OG584_15620 [Streptomyces sp. NBC_00859]
MAIVYGLGRIRRQDVAFPDPVAVRTAGRAGVTAAFSYAGWGA